MSEHWLCSKEEARILWYTSWTCAPAFLAQYFYYSQTDIALVTLFVLFTSLSYWRKPTYGCRRNMDMSCVFFGLFHNMYCAYGAEMAIYYYFFTGLGVNAYILGWYFYKRGHLKTSMYIHSLVHICANIANTCLAAGHLTTTPIVHLLLK
jgi:hypothetical protein